MDEQETVAEAQTDGSTPFVDGENGGTAAALYLDDLRVGQRFTSGSLRVEEAEIKAFAAKFDPQPFHLDEAAAQGEPVRRSRRQRLAHRRAEHASAGRRRPADRRRVDRRQRRTRLAAPDPSGGRADGGDGGARNCAVEVAAGAGICHTSQRNPHADRGNRVDLTRG